MNPCASRNTPIAWGDLYGQSPKTVGSNVVRMRKDREIVTRPVTTPATAGCKLQRRSSKPAKNRAIAICSRMGRRAMVKGTFQRTNPSCRSCRILAFSRCELAVLLMYSRSHCFVRMPIEAETRLRTRLENQRMLMRTERVSGWKEDDEPRDDGGTELTVPEPSCA